MKRYVIVDYPYKKHLSLVELNGKVIQNTIKTWQAGILHREVYNAIVKVSARCKGEFVKNQYLVPMNKKNKGSLQLTPITANQLKDKHWIFSAFEMDSTQVENLFWHIYFQLQKQTDRELSVLDDNPLENLVLTMQTCGGNSEAAENHVIKVNSEKYFIFPATFIEDLITIDILMAADLVGERFCRYCGKLYTDSKAGIYCSPSCNSRYIEQKDWPFEDRASVYNDFVKNYIRPAIEEKRAAVSGYREELNAAKKGNLTATVVTEIKNNLEIAQREFDIVYSARERFLAWQNGDREKIIQEKEQELEKYIHQRREALSAGLLNEDTIPEWHIGLYGNHSQELHEIWNKILHEEEAKYKIRLSPKRKP